MANTFTKIATVTVGAGGLSTISFTSIPSSYTDLCLKASMRTSRADTADPVTITFNGSSTTYAERRLWADGSSATTYTGTSIEAQYANSANSVSNAFSNFEMYIPNYAANQNKPMSYYSAYQNNVTTAYTVRLTGVWATSTAINTITLDPVYGNFVEHTTATLYGILKA